MIVMQLQNAVNTVFVQLSASIEKLTDSEYTHCCENLSKNSVGQHVRHVIELFQCLENGYEGGVVNYENRKRDHDIETNKELALRLLQNISVGLVRENKDLVLEACYGDANSESLQIGTNYYREIAYNLEHTIHHMALIRVGIAEVSSLILPADYGVAGSTVKFRKQCAQ
jgi:hypothetical protein